MDEIYEKMLRAELDDLDEQIKDFTERLEKLQKRKTEVCNELNLMYDEVCSEADFLAPIMKN